MTKHETTTMEATTMRETTTKQEMTTRETTTKQKMTTREEPTKTTTMTAEDGDEGDDDELQQEDRRTRQKGERSFCRRCRK